MKGKVGASMHLAYRSVVRRPRQPDPRVERIIIRWWYEWNEDGIRGKSPILSNLCRHGALAAAHGLLMGRTRYGIRRGSEVLIEEDGTRGHKRGVRAAQLYIDGRLVAGSELKDLLAKVKEFQDRKHAGTAKRIQKLDADLARIR